MQNGSGGRPTGVCTGDATEGRPGLSEPEGEAARIARERQPGARTNGLAAAIAEIKELYERECAGLMEPIDALERDHDLPRQRTDNPEPEWDTARMEADGARTRAARAVAALASEHEERLAARSSWTGCAQRSKGSANGRVRRFSKPKPRASGGNGPKLR